MNDKYAGYIAGKHFSFTYQSSGTTGKRFPLISGIRERPGSRYYSFPESGKHREALLVHLTKSGNDREAVISHYQNPGSTR